MSTRTDLLLTRAGISYRQLDFWVRQGYLHPRHDGGSGNRRDFGGEEERVLVRMGRLVTAGLRPDVAARVARETSEADGCGYARLGSGLLLKIYGEAA